MMNVGNESGVISNGVNGAHVDGFYGSYIERQEFISSGSQTIIQGFGGA